MADDIRLVIGVEQSGLLKAITSTETLEKKVKKLSDAYARDAVSYGRYNKAIGNLATATKKSKKELLDYGKALRADEQATKQATLATKQFAQARREAIAEDQRRTAEAKKATQVAAQQSAEEERLKNKFVQGYTAASLYSKELNDLGIARKRGIISIEQQRVALDRLNKEYAEGSGRFAMYANAMGKSANRAGVAMQQTGYQVGDFLVQVQSGTNPMVAFGQQATQLVGVLYLLPQATLAAKVGLMGLQVSMGALVAIVSIIIPLATAFGAYWMRAKDAADKAKGSILSLADAQDALAESTQSYKDKLAMLEFGVDTKAEAMVLKEILTKRKALAKLNEEYTTATLGRRQAISEEAKVIKTQLFDLRQVAAANKQIRAEYEAQAALQKSALDLVERNKQAELDRIKSIVAAFKAAEAERQKAREEAEESRLESVKLFYEYLQRDVDAAEELAKAVEKITDAVAKNTQSMERQVTLSELEVDAINLVEGAEKALADKKAEYARQDHIAQLLSQNIRGNNLKVAIDEYDNLVKQLKVQNEAKEAAKEKLRVEREAVKESKARSQAIYDALLAHKKANDAAEEQIRLQNQALSLQSLELKYTKDSEEYRRAENRFERENLALKLEQAGVDDSHIQSLIMGNLALKEGLDLLRAQRDVTLTMFEGSEAAQRMRKYASRGTPTGTGEPSGTTTGTGREDTRQTGREAVEQLIIQAKHKQKLVSLTDEQARYEDLLFKMQEDNSKKRNPLNEQQLQQEAKKIHLINEQTDAFEKQKQAQQDLADVVDKSMSDALMSMADGTKTVKDAFRDMARDIIKHLYEVLVVQQMVNAAKSFFGFPFADGGAFSGGSQIQAYADGGIVGSPTIFPMAGGKTGLMGEAGPEAIMPLKRGANGKLGVQMEGGGGDTINVVQNFSFAANGDDSVKRIIAQAAPQIANMTKKSLLDDRRRGGTTKAVFG